MFYRIRASGSVNPATSRRDLDHKTTTEQSGMLRVGAQSEVTSVTLPPSSKAGYVSEGLSEGRRRWRPLKSRYPQANSRGGEFR